MQQCSSAAVPQLQRRIGPTSTPYVRFLTLGGARIAVLGCIEWKLLRTVNRIYRRCSPNLKYCRGGLLQETANCAPTARQLPVSEPHSCIRTKPMALSLMHCNLVKGPLIRYGRYPTSAQMEWVQKSWPSCVFFFSPLLRRTHWYLVPETALRKSVLVDVPSLLLPFPFLLHVHQRTGCHRASALASFLRFAASRTSPANDPHSGLPD